MCQETRVQARRGGPVDGSGPTLLPMLYPRSEGQIYFARLIWNLRSWVIRLKDLSNPLSVVSK